MLLNLSLQLLLRLKRKPTAILAIVMLKAYMKAMLYIFLRSGDILSDAELLRSSNRLKTLMLDYSGIKKTSLTVISACSMQRLTVVGAPLMETMVLMVPQINTLLLAFSIVFEKIIE